MTCKSPWLDKQFKIALKDKDKWPSWMKMDFSFDEDKYNVGKCTYCKEQFYTWKNKDIVYLEDIEKWIHIKCKAQMER